MPINKFYRIIYVILHGLFTIVEWIYMIIGYLDLTRIHLLLKLSPSNWNTGAFQENLSLIKMPEHLTVLLGPEEVFIKELTNLVLWCLDTRISFISFYDYTGKMISPYINICSLTIYLNPYC